LRVFERSHTIVSYYMRNVEHWRMGPQRLRFFAHSKDTQDGRKFISLSGSRWIEAPQNGRSKEDINQTKIIYQAGPSSVRAQKAELEISVSAD
jgi:hypothetical protein